MKNEYEVHEEYTSIYICLKGLSLITLVDTEDLPRLVALDSTLYAHKRRKYGFEVRVSCKNKDVYLHRFIMDAPKGILVDHVNHDALDNRKSNLRLATPSENGQNKLNTLRGVRYRAERGKWEARLWLNGKFYFLGYFDNKINAKIAVKQARAKLMPFSQEALLNQHTTAPNAGAREENRYG